MMLHAFKTSASLAACLVIASACSSSTSSQLNALATDADASATIAKSLSPKASPVNLELLAALADQADYTGTAVAQTVPAGNVPAADWRIVPAKSVTFQRAAPTQLDTETEYSNDSLLVVPHDSDLLQGTVYESEAARILRQPVMNPGTYRTVEFKNQ